MSEEQKKLLETQLWNIANELRGKMDADEFRDYILGFIFYKYLSEKQYLYANTLLETEEIKDYLLVTDAGDLEAIKEESLLKLGYYLKPDELFSSILSLLIWKVFLTVLSKVPWVRKARTISINFLKT